MNEAYSDHTTEKSATYILVYYLPLVTPVIFNIAPLSFIYRQLRKRRSLTIRIVMSIVRVSSVENYYDITN